MEQLSFLTALEPMQVIPVKVTGTVKFRVVGQRGCNLTGFAPQSANPYTTVGSALARWASKYGRTPGLAWYFFRRSDIDVFIDGLKQQPAKYPSRKGKRRSRRT